MSVVPPSEKKTPRERLLAALSSTPERLDHATLAIAALEYPDLDPAASEAALESLAARAACAAPVDRLTQIRSLRRILADEEGFAGNTEDYDAPDNSFLNIVLQRKVGLPITLSVIYLEVARRAGTPLFGVSLPGHFVVGSAIGQEKLVIDPFHKGQILTESGCEDLLKRVAPQVRFSAKMIAPASVRSICYRMLSNLKRVYIDRGDAERALAVMELLLAIAPDHPGELRTRAAIFASLGAYRSALADVERCLEISPDAADHENLLLTAKTLRLRLEYLN
jgi:regulator of sirC expression with transglutaminase-like and TPR domain